MASCGLELLLLRTLISSSKENLKKKSEKCQAPIATDSPLIFTVEWGRYQEQGIEKNHKYRRKNTEEYGIKCTVEWGRYQEQGIEKFTNTGERIQKNME